MESGSRLFVSESYEFCQQLNVAEESPHSPSQHNDGGTCDDESRNLMRIEPFPIVSRKRIGSEIAILEIRKQRNRNEEEPQERSDDDASEKRTLAPGRWPS